MKKLFTLSTAVLAVFSVFAADEVSITWADPDVFFTAGAISPNGKWVCGGQSIWNLETGKMITSDNTEIRLAAISNNGLAVGNMGDYALKMDADGNYELFDGMTFDYYSTSRSISGDGSIITGSRFDGSFHQTPCYWENGTYHQLPVPDVMEDMPAEVEIYSVAAGSISEDRNVIVGNIITGTGGEAFVMWTRNEAGEYEFHPLYAGLTEFGWELEKPYVQTSSQCLSPNGKWVGMLLQLNSFDEFGYYAGRYNIETGEMVCMEYPEDDLAYFTGDYYATGITDQGTVVGFLEQEGMLMGGRQGYIWPSDSKMPEFLSTYCGGNDEISELESSDALVYTAIDGTGNLISGFRMTNGLTESFVININSDPSAVKAISTVQEGEKAMYDLQGRRVNGTPVPGIYILTEKGKTQKVLVK
ncbi:MAG: hypothetical protein K2K26_01150 [Muribaculaceae bacterium]|nr:hypothetical protein [Muribaculaceae bacterium]